MTNLRFRMRRCVLPHAEVTEEVAGAMQVDLPLSPPEGIVHADKEEAATDHPQLSQIQVSLFPGGDDLCDEQLVSYELGRKVIASGFLLPHILRSFFPQQLLHSYHDKSPLPILHRTCTCLATPRPCPTLSSLPRNLPCPQLELQHHSLVTVYPPRPCVSPTMACNSAEKCQQSRPCQQQGCSRAWARKN